MTPRIVDQGLKIMDRCEGCRWLRTLKGRKVCSNTGPLFEYSYPLNMCKGFAPKKKEVTEE